MPREPPGGHHRRDAHPHQQPSHGAAGHRSEHPHRDNRHSVNSAISSINSAELQNPHLGTRTSIDEHLHSRPPSPPAAREDPPPPAHAERREDGPQRKGLRHRASGFLKQTASNVKASAQESSPFQPAARPKLPKLRSKGSLARLFGGSRGESSTRAGAVDAPPVPSLPEPYRRQTEPQMPNLVPPPAPQQRAGSLPTGSGGPARPQVLRTSASHAQLGRSLVPQEPPPPLPQPTARRTHLTSSSALGPPQEHFNDGLDGFLSIPPPFDPTSRPRTSTSATSSNRGIHSGNDDFHKERMQRFRERQQEIEAQNQGVGFNPEAQAQVMSKWTHEEDEARRRRDRREQELREQRAVEREFNRHRRPGTGQ